jgi:dTDP-4-amino-4,6-dideoxygalactose transaminase
MVEIRPVPHEAYKIVHDFEKKMADYIGSKYAVAIDSCTNALFLCCKYLNVDEVILPSKTYVSVPCSVINSGGKVIFEDFYWEGIYQLKPYPIYDGACSLVRNSYVAGSFHCISFSANKILRIGKGGMIFTDSIDAVEWFKLARYEGRSEVSIMKDDFKMIGWNMYMTPEQAARGLLLSTYLQDSNIINPIYPDLSKYEVYTKANR